LWHLFDALVSGVCGGSLRRGR